MDCGHRGLRLFNCYHGLRVTTGSHSTTTAAGPKENTKGSAAASSSTSAGSRSRSGSTTTQGEQPAKPTKRWQRWRSPIRLRTFSSCFSHPEALYITYSLPWYTLRISLMSFNSLTPRLSAEGVPCFLFKLVGKMFTLG